MGTNYYLHNEQPEFTPKFTPIHIGKSSAGWYFSLHTYPEIGLNSWEDWKNCLDKNINNYNAHIENEYEDKLLISEFISIVERSRRDYCWEEESLRQNYAIKGINNLVHPQDCPTHESLPIAYCNFDFS